MNLILIGAILLMSKFTFGKSQNYYHPLHNITDLHFEVDSKSVRSLLSTNYMLDGFKSFEANIYIVDKTLDMTIETNPKIDLSIKNKIKNIILEKVDSILFFKSRTSWLETYTQYKSKNGWDFYTRIGLESAKEALKIKKEINKITFIQNEYKNKITTIFNYKIMKWSKNKLVLSSIERLRENRREYTNVLTKINYSKLDDFYWLPSSLEILTTHNVDKKSKLKPIRNIEENLFFINPTINQSKAIKWFSKKTK